MLRYFLPTVVAVAVVLAALNVPLQSPDFSFDEAVFTAVMFMFVLPAVFVMLSFRMAPLEGTEETSWLEPLALILLLWTTAHAAPRR